MKHQPKMLHNPSDKAVEVFSGGELVQFEAGESRIVEGNVAYQILTHQNTPLVEVKVEPVIPGKSETESGVAKNIEAMSYTELRDQAIKKGIWKKNMSKVELIATLKANGQS